MVRCHVMQVYKGLLCNLYPVAIKVVRDTTVIQKRNFRREVKILSNLRCPNVLSFVGACHLPGCTALISEYCQRGDLYHALADDRQTRMLSWYRRWAVGTRHCTAYAHSVLSGIASSNARVWSHCVMRRGLLQLPPAMWPCTVRSSRWHAVTAQPCHGCFSYSEMQTEEP